MTIWMRLKKVGICNTGQLFCLHEEKKVAKWPGRHLYAHQENFPGTNDISISSFCCCCCCCRCCRCCCCCGRYLSCWFNKSFIFSTSLLVSYHILKEKQTMLNIIILKQRSLIHSYSHRGLYRGMYNCTMVNRESFWWW